jgi:hypothetical protein
MRRVALAIIAATTVLTAPVGVLAAGAPIRKPPVIVSGLTIPAISTAPSAPALAPGMTQEQVFGRLRRETHSRSPQQSVSRTGGYQALREAREPGHARP